MVSALCDHQLRFGLLIPVILDMMDAVSFQQCVDLADRQLEVANVACHIVTIVLLEHRQLEMQMVCLTCNLDVAANVSVEYGIGVLIVHQRDKILLTQQETGGSSMKNIESSQSDEVRFGRNKLDKGTLSEVCHCDDLLSVFDRRILIDKSDI